MDLMNYTEKRITKHMYWKIQSDLKGDEPQEPEPYVSSRKAGGIPLT